MARIPVHKPQIRGFLAGQHTPVGTASDTVQDRMGEAVLCKPQIRGFWITRMMREMK